MDDYVEYQCNECGNFFEEDSVVEWVYCPHCNSDDYLTVCDIPIKPMEYIDGSIEEELCKYGLSHRVAQTNYQNKESITKVYIFPETTEFVNSASKCVIKEWSYTGWKTDEVKLNLVLSKIIEYLKKDYLNDKAKSGAEELKDFKL